MTSTPTLIEPGVKYFFNQTLKQCNVKKHNMYNTLCNLGFLFLFLGILIGILYYKKNTKKSEEQLKKEQEKDNNYILSTVKKYNDNMMREKQQLITNLQPLDPTDVMLQSYKFY